MSLYSRLDRLAADVEKLNRQVTAVANSPQSQRTSVEGGSIDFNDADGNLMAIMGGQDDGSNTIRHVDGPTPPIPSGLSAHVDGPIVQVSWDGTFESNVTHDWHYLEVLAVGPNNEQLTGTINDLSGGETSLAATSQGDWVITARSVSRAGKRSLGGDAGTVAVQLVGLTGAIDAVQESANGKNTIYYSPTEPTPPELGFNNGDLWFDTSEEGNNTASVWDGNGWVSMEDARLATIIAAQEALEADLQDVQTSVDGKNKITYDPALPPASYVGAVGDTWYRTSGNSMVGFWKWDGAAWVQQALDVTVIPQIDIGAGTFGSLDGVRLAAKSVTADKVLIGGGTELVDDPFLGSGDTMWYAASDAGAGSSNHSAEAAMPGRSFGFKLTQKTAGTAVMSVYAPTLRPDFRPPVEPGQKYHMTARVYATGAQGSLTRISLQGYAYNAAGAYISNQAAGADLFTVPAGEWLTVGGSWTAPANAYFTSPRLTLVYPASSTPNATVFYVGSVSVKEQVGATLIENGAITTDKLAAGSITAESGIIESLDLGKATVGELDGIRIMGQTVRGEQLSGDAIDGKVITGPTIQSGRSGRRWIGDPNGIRIINDDEDVRTQLSPEGSTFKGEVEADTLVVNEGAEFKANNTLAQGAKLTLAAGVTDPTAPPVVQLYWDGLEFTPANINGSNPVGLAWDGTNYITVGANRAKSGVASYFTGVYAMKINGATGEASRLRCDFSTAALDEQRVSEVFGVTCIGSELFFLGRYGYAGYVWVTDLAGVFKLRFTYPDLSYSATNRLVYRPGIGNNGTNIVIAQCNDSGILFLRTYNKTTGAKISDVGNEPNDGTKSDITGVHVGTADWGRNLATVAKSSNSKLPSFNPNTGVYDGATTQFDAASNKSVGIVFVDGKFRTLDPAGVIHEYADNTTGDNSGDWWGTYYWYTDVNGNNVIESSDYRSRMAPPARFTWPRRAMLKILGQPMPTGVEALGPALAKKTSTPTRTDFSGPPWSVDAGKPSARYTEIPANWTTFASPSDTNTYPEATSSALESASGTFQVKGDGSGHWGPLTMGRNGVMSGLVVTGQASCNVDTAGTPKKFTVQLPAGRFSKPPVVWLSPLTSSPQNVAVSVVGADITTTSFDLWFWRNDLSGTGVDWFAMDAE